MLNSLYKTKTVKEGLYESYKLLSSKPRSISSMSKKTLADELIKKYTTDPNVMLSILTESELFDLKKYYEKEEILYSDNTATLLEFGLLSSCPKTYSITITTELEELIKDVLEFYDNNKEVIDSANEKFYIFKGLLGVYGAATIEYLSELLKDLNIEFTPVELYNSPFVRRYVEKDEDNLYMSLNYAHYDEILRIFSYPVETLNYLKEELIEIGKNHINKNSKIYKEAISNPIVKKLIESRNTFLMSFEAGFNIADNEYVDFVSPYYSNKATRKEKNLYLKFIESLPKFTKEIRVSNKDVMSKEASNNFYKIIQPLIDYASKYYQTLIRRYPNGAGDSQDVLKLLEKASKDKFSCINSYIKENRRLSSNERKILNNIKEYHIFSIFTVSKHVEEGSIFTSDKGNYLVKGMTTPIRELIPSEKIPAAVIAMLVPYKGDITYMGVMAEYPINFGEGIKKIIIKELIEGKTSPVISNLTTLLN